MRGRLTHRAVLGILLTCQFSICLATETPDPKDSSKYLKAVREFADNVLKYGRDTYGPKHTPLFVDGLNIHNHEPVKWISPEGERWILSNLASQQNLMRTLDGLSQIMGDPRYRDAAMQAPDHNWGGSGMIGMQEMLMQTHSGLDERGKIRLFPAWPTEWNVDFKLHAPHRTTVECKVQSGKDNVLESDPV